MADDTFDYQKFSVGDRRVDKHWNDGESDVVTQGGKQWFVEEFAGKVAGWFVVHEAHTEMEVRAWLGENPRGS